MPSLKTSRLTSKISESKVVNGFIVVWTEDGMPHLEARRMVQLEGLHYRSTRTEDRKVYRLAEDFFIHQLPAYLRLKEILKAQQHSHQIALASIAEDLESVDLMIEQARREDR